MTQMSLIGLILKKEVNSYLPVLNSVVIKKGRNPCESFPSFVSVSF